MIDEPITVVAYDDRWPAWFAEEAEALRAAIGGAVGIEHIGSTAVPRLCAKPIVDIMVGVERVPPSDGVIGALTGLGYENLGEAGVAGRWYSRRRGERCFNTHVMRHGRELWQSNLLLRDFLRRCPEAAAAYGEHKREVVRAGARSLLAYSAAKAGVIAALLEQARAKQLPSGGAVGTALPLADQERVVMEPHVAKQIVRSGYDRVSYAYRPDEPDAQVVRQYEEWISLLRARVPSGGVVLDLGCGCGLPATQLLAQRYAVTGVDISPVQIKRATKLVPQAKFLCADMAMVDFASASFDAVVSWYALIHVPLAQQPMLLRRIAGWLKPGGVLMAIVGNTPWTGIVENWLGVKGGTMYWSHEGEETYRRWLREAGFDVEWTRFVPEGKGGHVLLFAKKGATGDE